MVIRYDGRDGQGKIMAKYANGPTFDLWDYWQPIIQFMTPGRFYQVWGYTFLAKSGKVRIYPQYIEAEVDAADAKRISFDFEAAVNNGEYTEELVKQLKVLVKQKFEVFKRNWLDNVKSPGPKGPLEF
jgi:hypothetical protein